MVSPVISRLGGVSSAAGGGSTTMMATVSLEVTKPSLTFSWKVRLAGCGGAVNEGLGDVGPDRETGWPLSWVQRYDTGCSSGSAEDDPSRTTVELTRTVWSGPASETGAPLVVGSTTRTTLRVAERAPREMSPHL